MQIQVLGSGCQTCHKLFELTEKAVDELNLKTEVEYVTGDAGIGRIMELGSLSAPVLAINGKIVLNHFTPDINELKKLILQAIK